MNYYTNFYVRFELDEKQVRWAKRALKAREWHATEIQGENFFEWELERQMRYDEYRDLVPTDKWYLDIHSPESSNLEEAAAFIQRVLHKTGKERALLEYSFGAGRHVPDVYGGWAAGYPLGQESTHADFRAAQDVYDKCETALDKVREVDAEDQQF